MAHTSDYDMIYTIDGTTPPQGVDMSEIAHILGVASLDLGVLSRHPNINMFSKYKPQKADAWGPVKRPTDTERKNNQWGLTIPSSMVPSQVPSQANWNYNQRTSNYRQLDFVGPEGSTLGYYSNAPSDVLTCVNKVANRVVNAVNERADNGFIAFYVFSNTGNATSNRLFDKEIDETQGIGAARNTSRMNCCLAVEDLVTTAGAIADDHPYFGILFVNTQTGTATFKPCPKMLSFTSSVLDKEMYQLPLMESAAPIMSNGTYTAYACIRTGNPLVPVGTLPAFHFTKLFSQRGTYRNTFTVKFGGTDLYSANFAGVAETTSGISSPTRSLRTLGSSVYVVLNVKNDSGILHYTGPSTFDKWVCAIRVTGTIVSMGTSHSVDRTFSSQISYPTQNFQITSGGTTKLGFLISRIWQWDPSTLPTQIDSGTLNISGGDVTLSYNGEAFPKDSIQLSATITYGS